MDRDAPPDPRLLYVRTLQGDAALRAGPGTLPAGARRLLAVVDGRRPLSELRHFVRPGELPPALELLRERGLVRAAGLATPDGLPATPDAKRELAAARRLLQGAFRQALGEGGIVLDARLQDAVSLDVLRRVLREGIDRSRREAGDDVAQALVLRARDALARARTPPGDVL